MKPDTRVQTLKEAPLWDDFLRKTMSQSILNHHKQIVRSIELFSLG